MCLSGCGLEKALGSVEGSGHDETELDEEGSRNLIHIDTYRQLWIGRSPLMHLLHIPPGEGHSGPTFSRLLHGDACISIDLVTCLQFEDLLVSSILSMIVTLRPGHADSSYSMSTAPLASETSDGEAVPYYYSSRISSTISWFNRVKRCPEFLVSVGRRRTPLPIEADWFCCVDTAGPDRVCFHVAARDFVKVIRILVACPTWTHAKFNLSNSRSYNVQQESRGGISEHSEVYSLLRSSPSLSCVGIGSSYGSPTSEYLPMLLGEDPRLQTVTVRPSETGATNFSVLTPRSIALCLSRNLVLKSFVLRLKLGSTSGPWSEDVTYTWMDHGRALEVKYVTTLGSYDNRDPAGLRELLTAFVLDHQPSSITLSTLHLILTDARWGQEQAFASDLFAILRDLASMLKLNATLKHVQLSYEFTGGAWGDDHRRTVELRTQEMLREMVGNELRANTSLETFAAGFWKLRRVGGVEWHTSYGGPCLRAKPKLNGEYLLKVKMPAS